MMCGSPYKLSMLYAGDCQGGGGGEGGDRASVLMKLPGRVCFCLSQTGYPLLLDGHSQL